MDLNRLKTFTQTSRKGQGTVSITEEKQFRGDQRAGQSLNQGGGFAGYKDEFSP